LFAKAGAQLALADIHAEGLKEVANLIAKAGGTAIIKKTDVSKEDEVKALIALALKSYSKIDILCNIAGVAEEITGLDQQDRSAWHRVYDVNVMGVVYTTKHVCLHMQGRKCGAIVNISSVAGIRSGAAETRGVGMFAHPPPEERQANIEYTLKVFRTFSGSGFPLDEEWHRKIAAQAYDRAF
jgi:NADP-dependent 3-hydroxy acid dehydrogenase YdfG